MGDNGLWRVEYRDETGAKKVTEVAYRTCAKRVAQIKKNGTENQGSREYAWLLSQIPEEVK